MTSHALAGWVSAQGCTHVRTPMSSSSSSVQDRIDAIRGPSLHCSAEVGIGVGGGPDAGMTEEA